MMVHTSLKLKNLLKKEGDNMEHGFVTNGFISHNTGRLSSQNPSMHTIPIRTLS